MLLARNSVHVFEVPAPVVPVSVLSMRGVDAPSRAYHWCAYKPAEVIARRTNEPNLTPIECNTEEDCERWDGLS